MYTRPTLVQGPRTSFHYNIVNIGTAGKGIGVIVNFNFEGVCGLVADSGVAVVTVGTTVILWRGYYHHVLVATQGSHLRPVIIGEADGTVLAKLW